MWMEISNDESALSLFTKHTQWQSSSSSSSTNSSGIVENLSPSHPSPHRLSWSHSVTSWCRWLPIKSSSRAKGGSPRWIQGLPLCVAANLFPLMVFLLPSVMRFFFLSSPVRLISSKRAPSMPRMVRLPILHPSTHRRNPPFPLYSSHFFLFFFFFFWIRVLSTFLLCNCQSLPLMVRFFFFLISDHHLPFLLNPSHSHSIFLFWLNFPFSCIHQSATHKSPLDSHSEFFFSIPGHRPPSHPDTCCIIFFPLAKTDYGNFSFIRKSVALSNISLDLIFWAKKKNCMDILLPRYGACGIPCKTNNEEKKLRVGIIIIKKHVTKN